jgi:large subunit ribosomal protein L30
MAGRETEKEMQTPEAGGADGRTGKARASSGGADKRRLRLTQTRSAIGQSPRHRGTLRALGLGRIGKTAEHDDTPAIAGMLRKVRHLVKVDNA